MENSSLNIVRSVFYITTFVAILSNVLLLVILTKHWKLKGTLFPFYIQGIAVTMLLLSLFYAIFQPVLILHNGMRYVIFLGFSLSGVFKSPFFFFFSFLKVLCFFNSFFGIVYRYFSISRGMSSSSKGVIALVITCVLTTFIYDFTFYKLYRDAFEENGLDILYYIRVVRSYTNSQLPTSSIYMAQFDKALASVMNFLRFTIFITSAILHYLTMTKPVHTQHLSQRRAVYNRELNQVCTTTAVIVYCFIIGPYILLDVFSFFNVNTHMFTLPLEAFSATTTVIFPVICITNVKQFRRSFLNFLPFKRVQQEQSLSNK